MVWASVRRIAGLFWIRPARTNSTSETATASTALIARYQASDELLTPPDSSRFRRHLLF
jgi:hypothetical protein